MARNHENVSFNAFLLKNNFQHGNDSVQAGMLLLHRLITVNGYLLSNIIMSQIKSNLFLQISHIFVAVKIAPNLKVLRYFRLIIAQ